jgi:hypothetical protein
MRGARRWGRRREAVEVGGEPGDVLGLASPPASPSPRPPSPPTPPPPNSPLAAAPTPAWTLPPQAASPRRVSCPSRRDAGPPGCAYYYYIKRALPPRPASGARAPAAARAGGVTDAACISPSRAGPNPDPTRLRPGSSARPRRVRATVTNPAASAAGPPALLRPGARRGPRLGRPSRRRHCAGARSRRGRPGVRSLGVARGPG